jgi:hypothetical protein
MGLFKQNQKDLTADEYFKKYGSLNGYTRESDNEIELYDASNDNVSISKCVDAVSRLGRVGVVSSDVHFDSYRDVEGVLHRVIVGG